jgi:hypothetical protein
LSGCPSLTDSDVNKYAIININLKLGEKKIIAGNTKGEFLLLVFLLKIFSIHNEFVSL